MLRSILPVSYTHLDVYKRQDQVLFVSATPGQYEEEHELLRAQQVIRPTGLLDPEIEVRPVEGPVSYTHLKSYWEYEKRYQKKQRDLQIAKMQKTDVMLGDYLEYWFENIFSPRIETTTRMVGAYTLYNLILPSMEADIKLRYISVEDVYKRQV